MGNVLGARPTVAQMQAYVTKSWNHVSLHAVQYFRRGWFSFRFTSAEDMDEVLKGGPWSLGSNSLVLKKWSPNFSMEMDKLSVVPIWILFPELDPVPWSDVVLSKIASKVGKPLYADMTTTCKARLSFARVLVEADLATDLPEQVILNTLYHGQIVPTVPPLVPASGPSPVGPTKNGSSKARGKRPIVVEKHTESSTKDSCDAAASSSEATLHNSYTVLPIEGNDVELQDTSSQLLVDNIEPMPPDKNEDSTIKHRFKASNQSIAVTFVYGFNDPRARVGLWDELTSISATITQAWVVLGDFNVVRKLSERAGPNPPSTQDILDFNACLAHCYLDDMHSMGYDFTWSNKQCTGTRTWARLDRVLVNPDWLLRFPSSFALSLPPGVPDHSPLLVTVAPAGSIKRRFSFLNIWHDHSDYKRLIATAWQIPCYGSPMYQLFHKLKSVRSSLQILHKESFSDISGKVQAIKKQLDACQTALQADLFSPQLIEQEKNLLTQYAELNKQEMDMLFQRAKDGIVRYGLDHVNSAFVEYYTGLLGGEVKVEPLSDIVLSAGPKVSVEAGFFKSAWDIVGDTFCLAVEEYFRKGRMMRKVNTTLLALVPKKEVPLTVQDFRPITCCSVVYKTISKIIANRLQKVLPELVGNEQAAFIKGRSIFENIMMSQNLIKGYNQSLISTRCLIKVDIRKAFNSLQWEFIRQMLHGLGSPSQFFKWTMGCITSPWFSLKINGTLYGFFPGKSGVR
ncbi:uncharacterized protein LOC141613701 [Silene latifolia]|uniref:uncharacterized protein LOC141613701 n=1 Tax=Silene latifolia TaxID=37657 RepID=UPI003D785C44